ncbi:MAG: hypothetical protein K6G81_08145 [Lachnospiraceae bacterium]|nr:hypothetical protein [Lachnospiraceae bacterium]
MDILLIGSIAEDGVLKLISKNWDSICFRYAAGYISEGVSKLTAEFADDAALKIMRDHDADVFVIARQGIFQALYMLGENEGCGLKVWLDKIPIRQFCIETADLCDVNPYHISSLGCVLACCNDGLKLVDKLEQAGYKSVIIGFTTEEKARCVITEAGIQYLTPDR